MSDIENPADAAVPPESIDVAPDAEATLEDPTRRRSVARRRKLPWGLLVVLLGAAIGAAVGWESQVPVYQSEGVLLVEPSLKSLDDPTGSRVLPMFEAFIAFQVELLRQRRTTLLALGSEAWQETDGKRDADAATRFEERSRIVHRPGSQHIVVRFQDPDPEIALAGVNALMRAYVDLASELNHAEDADLLQVADARIEALTARIQTYTLQIIEATKDYGGVEGVELRHRAVVEQLIETEQQLARLRETLRKHELSKHETRKPATPGEIAVESAAMAQYLLDLELLEAQAAILAEQAAESHEALRALRTKISAHERRIRQFAEDWNRARAAREEGPSVDDLEGRIEALEERLEVLRAQARRLGQILEDVARLQAERRESLQKLEHLKGVRSHLEATLTGTGRVVVGATGALPTEPYRDDRVLYAWIGGVIGGLGAMLLFLLFGIVARRMGRAADANAYHAKVRAAVQLLPKRIGEWKAHDVGVPPGAAKLPRANVAMGRQFQNPSTGENATLRIVQCRDARDLSAYYPPIQYPAEGWTLREAEPRHLPALLAAIPGTVYRFTRESADGSSEVLVYNFFARPDGSIESGPTGALNAASETHTQALGAAQFQILLGPTMTRDRRDEVFRTLIAAALPVMDALCVEEDA